MRVHSADALILRTYRYGEADRIVVFLTEDRGKRRGVAKNATKSRRRFGGALEPMTRGRVTYVERENRELVRLDRIELRESPLRSGAGRPPDEAAHALGHAAYFAELVDEWAPDHAANERLFRLGAAMSERLAGRVRLTRSRATSSIGCSGWRASIRTSTGVRTASARSTPARPSTTASGGSSAAPVRTPVRRSRRKRCSSCAA